MSIHNEPALPNFIHMKGWCNKCGTFLYKNDWDEKKQKYVCPYCNKKRLGGDKQ